MKKKVFGDEEKWLVELIVGIVLCVMGFLFMAVLPNAAIVIILVGIVYIVIGSRRKRKQNKTENYQDRPRGSGAFVQRDNSVPARQRNLPPQQSYTAPRSKWNFTIGDIYNVNVVGVMHENNGINPQSIIPNLKERDEIVLQWDINNKYDNTAIQVKTTSNQHLGWIARDDEVKPILINAFKNGYDVIAWVARTYDLHSKPGNLGLAIEFTIAEKQSFQT